MVVLEFLFAVSTILTIVLAAVVVIGLPIFILLAQIVERASAHWALEGEALVVHRSLRHPDAAVLLAANRIR